jgi:hypothetical protein
MVQLSVRDNGDGFDPSASATGFGLLGMHERVQLLGGEIEIHSSPGGGTLVTANIPVQRRPAEAPAQRAGKRHFSGALRRSTNSANSRLASSISGTASANLKLRTSLGVGGSGRR